MIMKKLLLALLIAGAVGGFAYYKFGGEKELQYMTIHASRGDVVETVLASGTLVGRNEVEVGAQVNGQIQKLYVKLGDKVKKGDMIAEIDPRTQLNSLSSAKAELRIVQADKKQTEALLKQQELEYNRQLKMKKGNATSDADLEKAEANLAQTRAKLESCDANIEKAKISVSTAETNLGYTKITAPRDGVVIGIVTEEGQTVVSTQSAPTIVKIADLETMTVEAEISEADVVKVKPGMNSYFTILGLPDRKFVSTFRDIEPATESESSSSSSSASSSSSSQAIYYNALLDVDNSEGILRKSMTAEVTIILGESKDVLYLPIAVLNKNLGNSKYMVYVKGANGKAEERVVTVGRKDNINYEIVDGITEKDEIIIGSDVASAEAASMAAGNSRRRGPRL